MKILYHHRIASKDGQAVHIEEIVNSFKKMGHKVIIVGPRIGRKKSFGSKGGYADWFKKFLPRAIYELLELAYSFIAFTQLAFSYLRHQPDFIYERYNLYLLSGVWLKKLFKVPLLLEVNSPLFEERCKYNGLVLRRLAMRTERYIWQSADYVLPVTEVLAGYVKRTGVNSSHIVVVHNGVDLDRFSPDQCENAKQMLSLQGKLVLGFVGFMREWHGLDKLVPLLKNLEWQSVHLLLVGDGPAKKDIIRVAKQEGVESRVTITGVVPRTRVSSYIAAFDIALQPDVVDYASPLKLFEYMAMCKAIVAPATDNIREILTDHENALLFTNGQAGLISKVQMFVNDEEIRFRLAKNARRTIIIKGFTWRCNAEKIIALASAIKLKEN